ncbi:hypothetical protein AB0K89_17215 [Streptomyces cinnamoneus]|uniref:hypothetical protein n=1 Tax=Streptomyces cinnamoneus TaxID=53446 RepID=UPI00342C2A35
MKGGQKNRLGTGRGKRRSTARRSDRHPLADQICDALTIVVVIVVVAVCSPGLSPEALTLIGVLATVLGHRERARARQ